MNPVSSQTVPVAPVAPSATPQPPVTADPFQLVITHTCIDDDQRQARREQLTALVAQVRIQKLALPKDSSVEHALAAKIAEIDRYLKAKLNAILHNPKFQALEASWRGLHHLVQKTQTSPMLKLKVLDAAKDELRQDLERASTWENSQLFNHVYNKAFGRFGATPYSVLVGDFEFGRSAADVSMLTKLSQIAAAAHAPFIGSASPQLLDMRSFTELEDETQKLADRMDNALYVKWNAFRQSEDSRYVALVAPRVLMRLPFLPRREPEAEPEKTPGPVEKFDFAEDVSGRDHSKYLWGNASYALANRITDAFYKNGWYMAICGLEGGGQVADLPVHTFKTDKGHLAVKSPTEVTITERRARELITQGFIPLVMYEGRDYAVFIDAPSAQKPQEYTDEAANANARLSADLRCILAASRFTHYLKAITRDKLGSFLSAKQCESDLSEWIIRNYTVENPDAKQAIKASRPLRSAKVLVKEDKRRPGRFIAQVDLLPHIPFKEMSAAVSMVATLPERGK